MPCSFNFRWVEKTIINSRERVCQSLPADRNAFTMQRDTPMTEPADRSSQSIRPLDQPPTATGPTIYLVDGTAYVYRAYHAIRELTNSKGIPTNAVFGFTRMLVKLFQDRTPAYAAMFFDAKGPTFRHDMYADYKANRPPMPEDMRIQIAPIKTVTDGFNIPIIEMPGYEADDLIGTVAGLAEKAGFSVVMVTGDKDFMQLVTDRTVIWDPMKDKTVDRETVRADFGVDPHQLIDVMGLSGDTADNIPGVPGIGPKTALKLIQRFGDMDRLYEQVDTITQKKQRENLEKFRDQAFLSRRLVVIDTRVPVPFSPADFACRAPDNDRLFELFKDMEFRQLQLEFSSRRSAAKKVYRPVMTLPELEDLVRMLASADRFALDTETTSTDPMVARLIGLSFSVRCDEAFYIPCAHDYLGVPRQLELATVLDRLRPVLENAAIKKIGQNIKYDWMVLARHGIDLQGVFFDTMLASYLINPSKRSHSLDQIAMDFLGHRTITYADVAGKGKKAAGFNTVVLEKAVPYACEDADITLAAFEILGPMVEKAGLSKLMETVELPLVPVLMHMEMAGICVDREKLMSLSKTFDHRMQQLEKEIYSLSGEHFNIRSSQQLGRILFEKIGLQVQKKNPEKNRLFHGYGRVDHAGAKA